MILKCLASQLDCGNSCDLRLDFHWNEMTSLNRLVDLSGRAWDLSFTVVPQVANQLNLRNTAALVTVHQCPHSFEVCRGLRWERILDKGQTLRLIKCVTAVNVVPRPDFVDEGYPSLR